METTAIQTPYFPYEDAARYCNVHRVTLWRAVRDGRLRASGYGRAVRFHIRDLDAFMASRDGQHQW